MHHTSALPLPPTQFMVLDETSTLTFSMAEMSVAEMSGPKCPRLKFPWLKCPTFIISQNIYCGHIHAK